LINSQLKYIYFFNDICFYMGNVGEIIESSSEPRYLSTVALKNFNLFKIAVLVINFCLKNFLTNNFKQMKVF